MCEWKDGPGKMSYPDTVNVKTVGWAPSNHIEDENVYVAFDVFGSHAQVTWYVNNYIINVRSNRSLSDKQEEYLIFLTKLWGITSYFQ